MISVAIDGPAGAGKSSISKTASKKLGFIYVDTGALYRSIALNFIRKGADESLSCDIDGILKQTSVEIRFVNGEQHVFLNSEDVNDKIRTPEVSLMASAVSAKPQVREFLLDMQRNLAKTNNVLMDGRDIGTVVLPDATVKIFLTASEKVRAERRYKELCEKGIKADFDEVYNDIVKRDFNDMNRPVAPLKQAKDAILADTSALDFEQSVELIIRIIKEKTGEIL